MIARRFQEMRLWVCAVAFALLPSGCERSGEVLVEAQNVRPSTIEDTTDFSGQNAYLHCAAICDMGPRPTGSPAYARQLDYLERHLRAVGWRVQRDVFSPHAGRTMVNLRAEFGAEEGGRPLLVSCHIDTKGQGDESILGADDGASGAAVLLELARVLGRDFQTARQVELIFFDGEESLGERITEEDGLYGSRYDVNRRGKEAMPDGVVNLDMVGGAGKIIAVPIMDTVPEMCDIYMEAVQELGFSKDRWTYHLGSYWDDHRPYMEAGTPTLNIIASFMGSNWWHNQRDNMQRISAASLDESGRLALKVISLWLEKRTRAKGPCAQPGGARESNQSS